MTQPSVTNRNLLYYFRVLARHRWLLLILISVATVTALLSGLRTKRLYQSTATIILIEGKGGGALSALSSQFGSLGTLFSGGTSSTGKIIKAILKSRRMADDIQEHFGFEERFGVGREQAIRMAKGMLTVYDWETTLAIEVTGGDPKLITEIANFCVTNLNEINEELDITTEKPFVRLLDTAEIPKVPIPREIKKKMLIAALISFLMGSAFVLLVDYLRHLKELETFSQVFEKEEMKV